MKLPVKPKPFIKLLWSRKMKITHKASKLFLPVAVAGFFGIASITLPSLGIAGVNDTKQEMMEDKAEMDARKEIKHEADELKAQTSNVTANTTDNTTENNANCEEKMDKKDKKGKKDKKDKKDKKAMSKAHKHARELAVKHNMTNRAALPEKDREMIKHGNILSDKIAREKVAEPLKSELEGNPEYEWVPEDEWFIVGQDLVRVHKPTNKITSVMRGVFR